MVDGVSEFFIIVPTFMEVPMIHEIMHVGLTVSDLERTKQFYGDVLGLKFVNEIELKGEESDILFGRTNVHARVAYMNGSDEIMAPPVELIQFVNDDVKKEEGNLFQTSISELCFRVNDLDKTYNDLKAKGVTFLSRPCSMDFRNQGLGMSKAVYLKDPDGIILELMEVVEERH